MEAGESHAPFDDHVGRGCRPRRVGRRLAGAIVDVADPSPRGQRLGGPARGRYQGSTAWEGAGIDPSRRIYWALDNAGIPATTELYRIDFYYPTVGLGQWQPIESQFRGVDGEQAPYEPLIPWIGAYGTNHQWIGATFSGGAPGTWKATGPGPHTPESEEYTAGANGVYMWLTAGSWLYAKWDFTFSIDHTWAELRVTQVTPEPGGLVLLLIGGAVGLRRRG